MGVRGHGTMYCNTNSGKSQCHLVDIRGHGTMYCNTILWNYVGAGTINRTLRLLTDCHFVVVYVYTNTKKICLHVHLQLAITQQHTQNAYFRIAKTILLQCKNPLFAHQKPYFCTAKRGFLFFVIMVDVFADAGKRFYFAGVVG